MFNTCFSGAFVTLRNTHQNSFHPPLCLSAWKTRELQTHFHEIWYWRALLKFLKSVQFSFRSDNFNDQFTLRHTCCSARIFIRVKTVTRTNCGGEVSVGCILCSIKFSASHRGQRHLNRSSVDAWNKVKVGLSRT
jgi:hypothetical protein